MMIFIILAKKERGKMKKIEFVAELQALLKKYDAEITCQNNWQGYPECGSDIQMVIEFQPYYDEIKIGTWIDKDGHGGGKNE